MSRVLVVLIFRPRKSWRGAMAFAAILPMSPLRSAGRLNFPARYVTGHLPDIGCFDPGTPMDFHAYFEVYLEHQWRVFDARFNVPRIGRVKIAHGLDAVDGSFSTVYGQASLPSLKCGRIRLIGTSFPIGDPIDLSKRLDGTPQIRFA